MKRYNFISSNLYGRTAEVYEDEEGRWVRHSDALAAIEQARREAFEEAAEVVEHSGGFDTHVRAQLAAAIRARGATGVYTQEDLDWAKQRAEERAKRIKVE